MTDLIQRMKQLLDALQEYALSYFKVVFGSVFEFWTMPSVPAGANVLTGTFAILLVLAMRFQLGLSTDTQGVLSILGMMFFFILFVCGVMMVADPAVPNRLDNFKKLASVVSVGISLGCGLIALDAVLRWIGPILEAANQANLEERATYQLISMLGALLATVLIFANTFASARSAGRSIATIRLSVWTFACFLAITLGISLIVAPPF